MGLKADWAVKKRSISLKKEQLETIQTEAQHGEKRNEESQQPVRQPRS